MNSLNSVGFGARASMAIRLLSAGLLAVCTSRISPAQPFVLGCDNPSFPGDQVAIDQSCDVQGAGGKEAEQNAVKNDFCASGNTSTLKFDDLRMLQGEVDKNKSINYGDAANHGVHGPTTDRAPLKDLGEGKLVQLVAYVLAAKQEKGESVNCGHAFDSEPQKNLFHDIHIALVETKDLASPADPAQEAANECQGIVAEMVPHHRPAQWTAENVRKVARAHLPVRVTGQLFFDSSHVPCNSGQPVRTNPKRVSLWEIHPIYKFEICTDDCEGVGTWIDLEHWAEL